MSDEERVAFAVSVTKFALVNVATVADIGKTHKAINMTRFRRICDDFADEVRGFPDSMASFKADERS